MARQPSGSPGVAVPPHIAEAMAKELQARGNYAQMRFNVAFTTLQLLLPEHLKSGGLTQADHDGLDVIAMRHGDRLIESSGLAAILKPRDDDEKRLEL